MHLSNNINLQNGLVGGLIIGGASTLLMYTQGKIAGISGILSNMLVFKPNDDKRWCWSFIMGLITSGSALVQYYPQAFTHTTSLTQQSAILAGIITGFGTRLGSGKCYLNII